MSMNRHILSCILILVISVLANHPLQAQSKVGTSAASFLGISVGMKATAMGSAFTAVADDPSAIHWNPGAISRYPGTAIYATVSNYLVESQHTWVGVKVSLIGNDALGISINHLDYGDRQMVTSVSQPAGTGEYWEAHDLSMGISYARNITDRFSLGGTVKYIEQTIWHEKAWTSAVDLGLLFITQFNGLRIGATIRNFGGEMRLEGRDLRQRIDIDPQHLGNNETLVAYMKTDSWPIPLSFCIGTAMPITVSDQLQLTLAADAIRPTNNDDIFNTGAEIRIYDRICLRAGYQNVLMTDNEKGFNCGIGLRIPFQNWSVCFDYSFQEFQHFNAVQGFAMNIGFGK